MKYPVPDAITGQLDAAQLQLVAFNMKCGDFILHLLLLRFVCGFSRHTSWSMEFANPSLVREVAQLMPINPVYTVAEGQPTAQPKTVLESRMDGKALMRAAAVLRKCGRRLHGNPLWIGLVWPVLCLMHVYASCLVICCGEGSLAMLLVEGLK